MPTSLQRLSSCMNTILSVLECPVCLDTVPPPAHQCANGHLICARCRLQSERCPVCRQRLSRGRSLLADKVYNSLTEAFHLKVLTAITFPSLIQHRAVLCSLRVSDRCECLTTLLTKTLLKLLTNLSKFPLPPLPIILLVTYGPPRLFLLLLTNLYFDLWSIPA